MSTATSVGWRDTYLRIAGRLGAGAGSARPVLAGTNACVDAIFNIDAGRFARLVARPAVTSASDATGIYAFGRGFGDALWYNRLANNAWSGPQVFGGVPLTSDPVAVAAPNAIYLFGRSSANQLWHGHIDSGTDSTIRSGDSEIQISV